MWQSSMELASACFDIVDAIPPPFKFIFANQLLRAAVSIPSNIAEGNCRPRKAYRNHISIARGSHAEVETLLEVLARRGIVPSNVLVRGTALIAPIGRMLNGLAASLGTRSADR